MTAPVLVACSHGTAVARGRSTVGRLAVAAGKLRPELEIRQAFVDVQPPSVGDVVRELTAAGRSSIVVPLLLSTGFHVNVDIGESVLRSNGLAVAGEPLGAGAALAPVLIDRLAEARVGDDVAVVVAAAGSSDPGALRDLRAVVGYLADRRSGAISGGYVSSPDGSVQTVAQLVDSYRSQGQRTVVVASYLLTPGVFQARLADAGADLVTESLGLHPLVVSRVLASYDAARETLPAGR